MINGSSDQKKLSLSGYVGGNFFWNGMRKGMGFLKSVSNSIISLCATLFLILVDVKLFFKETPQCQKKTVHLSLTQTD